MSKPSIDVDAARKLVDEISANLESLPAGGARQAELRAEVDALRALLERDGAAQPDIEHGMKNVHGTFERYKEELQADGLRAGMFLSALGRMLGLD